MAAGITSQGQTDLSLRMQNGERELSSPASQRQRELGVEKPGKFFVTEDEGIGGSENNTPRPGSAVPESRPPASTTPAHDLSHSLTKRRVHSPPQPSTRSAGSPLRQERTSAASSGSSMATSGSADLSGPSDESEIDVVARFNSDHVAQSSSSEVAVYCGGDDDSLAAVNGYASSHNHESRTQVSEVRGSSASSAEKSGPNPEESVTPTTSPKGSPFSRQQNAENLISGQLQQAMSVLKDYESRLKEQGGAATADLEQDETLKKTLETVTSLCQTCSSTSATLGKRLQQARQLTDNISKELSHKLESTDLRDWIPPEYRKAGQ